MILFGKILKDIAGGKFVGVPVRLKRLLVVAVFLAELIAVGTCILEHPLHPLVEVVHNPSCPYFR
jgi:hypothetical protein